MAGSLPSKETSLLKGHDGAVLAVRFNSDGNYCLSCGKDRTIRLWNPHRGIHIKTYKAHARDVRDVHVTRIGTAGTAFFSESVFFGTRFKRVPCNYGRNHIRRLTPAVPMLTTLIAYNQFKLITQRDNSKICSCGGDRNIFYWDVSTGRVIRKFRGHDNEVNSLKFNEFSTTIISGGYDHTLRAWDCRSHSTEPIQTIDTFSDSVMSVCLTNTEIIAGSVDGTIRTFDIRMGREIVDQLGQSVNCISISNDNNCILASCLDSTLRLLDRSSGELLQEYKGHICKSYKMDCCLTNTDAHIVGGSEDGHIYFWDLVEASVVSSFRAHASVVTSVSYHPKESCMITSSVDSTIRVWKC